MREESLFLAALDLPTAATRAAFLDAECGGDAGLRERVERLLAADRQTTGPLAPESDTAGPGGGRPGPGPGLAAGREVAGRYVLARKLGEGGMGEVWEADQARPVRRPVALKVIRPGLDAAALLARFDQERQAIALMAHPGIAQVYDAGVADGLPYLALELVDGPPLTAYCDARKLPVPQRLELFQQVCGAVQHAHQKGVIHRDLKPSNILVAETGGKPVPKVIDFGIAKAAGARLTDETVRTGAGAILGTLEYMAPEQAAGAADVDTRADVYALGVILYELLAGTTPIRQTGFDPAGLLEQLRAVREDDPPPPSRRVTSASDRPALAAARGADPRGLAAAVRGDLDWIVMKALEKDRSRRYDSAAALARDVGRHLADEPVEAGPPTAAYRLRKFARRNRPQVVAAGLVLLAVVAGGAVAVWQAVRATAAEGRARANERRALDERDEKEKARQAADEARARADEEAATAREIAAVLQDGLLSKADTRNQSRLAGRNPNVTARELLDRIARRLDGRFADQPRTEAAVRYTIGRAYHGLGEPAAAQGHLERALALRSAGLGPDDPETLDAAAGLGVVLHARGRFARAEELLARAVAGYRRTRPADDPDLLEVALQLGAVYTARGRYADAESLLVRSLDGLRARHGDRHYMTLLAVSELADLYRTAGRPADAAPLIARLRELAPEVLGPDHTDAVTADYLAASVHRDEGRLDEAARLFAAVADRRAKAFGPDHPDTLEAVLSAGQIESMRGDFARAEPLIRRALDGFRARLGDDDRHTLNATNSLAVFHQRRGRPAEAVPLMRPVVAAWRDDLGPTHPNTLTAVRNLAVALHQSGDPAAALPLFEEAARGHQARGFKDPLAAKVLENVVGALEGAGRPADADGWRRKWLAVVKARAGAGSAEYAGGLAEWGLALLGQGKHAEAEPVLRECLAIRERAQPDAWTTSNTRSLLGGALLGMGKPAEAEPLLLAGYAGMKERAKAIPPAGRVRLPEAADRLVELYENTHRPDEAAKWRAERATYPSVAPPPRPAAR